MNKNFICALFLVVTCYSQNNLMINSGSDFTVSLSYENHKDNSVIITSPCYSINDALDLKIDFGYSIKEPHMMVINPSIYIRIIGDVNNKSSFNFAYGLGYRSEDLSKENDNMTIEYSAHFFQMYYLLYFNITMDEMIFQPQLNLLYHIGENKTITEIMNVKEVKESADSYAKVKIGLACIFKVGENNVHIMPGLFIDDNETNFFVQFGSTL